MKCKRSCAELIKFFDLFSLSQFLRYKEDEDFKTVSGGIISILVVIIFSILFAGNAISTVNKTDISFKKTTEGEFIPSKVTLNNNNFMFALGIMSVNHSDPTSRYFDISMIEAFQNTTTYL